MELAILLLWFGVGWLVPVLLVGYIASKRGYSRHYIWWPALLGWLGAGIGIVILLLKPERPPETR